MAQPPPGGGDRAGCFSVWREAPAELREEGAQETFPAEELRCGVEVGLRQTLSAEGKSVVAETFGPTRAHL